MPADDTDRQPSRRYNQVDHPATVAVLRALLAGRDPLPAGYEPTDSGAAIDWDLLAYHSYLSTSEVAVVEMLRGIARLERHGGGVPACVHASLRQALDDTLGA